MRKYLPLEIGASLLIPCLLVGCKQEAAKNGAPVQDTKIDQQRPGGHTGAKPRDGVTKKHRDENNSSSAEAKRLSNADLNMLKEKSAEAAIEDLTKRFEGDELREALAELGASIAQTGDLKKILDYMQSLPPGDMSRYAVSNSMYAFAKGRPDAFFTDGKELRDALPKRDFEFALLHFGHALGEEEDPKAYEKIQAAQWLTPNEKLQLLGAVLTEWSGENSVNALAAAQKGAPPELLPELVTNYLKDFGEVVKANPDSIASVISSADAKSVQSLNDKFAAAVAKERPKDIESIARQIQDPQVASDFQITAYANWARSDLNSALTSVQNCQDVKVRQSVIRRLLPLIKEYDPAGAKRWEEQLK